MIKQPINFRIKRAYGFYRVGEIIQPTGAFREGLIAGGWIEPVGEPVETAVRPSASTATATMPEPPRVNRAKRRNQDEREAG